jgi:hypothetical protein
LSFRPQRSGKPWFDRLTTLSKVEGESSDLSMFWMPDQVRHDEFGLFARPSDLRIENCKKPMGLILGLKY